MNHYYRNKCLPYELELEENGHSFDMKYHVFIPKQTTRDLASFIIQEDWGKGNFLLYKYLDYIWRFQLIDKMVKIFTYNGIERLIFNTGLHINNNNAELYLCLSPNNEYNKNDSIPQKWRVNYDEDNNEAFLDANTLVNKFGLCRNDLPKRTNFLKNNIDSLFHVNYSFFMDSWERVRTVKHRILTALQNDIGYKDEMEAIDLKNLIENGIKKSLNIVRNNPNLIGRQIFVERHVKNAVKITTGYHLELLLPLTIKLNNKCANFAVVLRPNHKHKTYEGMSVITRNMAYSNSRLIDYVTTPWLTTCINIDELSLYNNNCAKNSTNFFEKKQVSKKYTLNTNECNYKNIFDESVYITNTNPFFYLATILPLTLPKLKFGNINTNYSNTKPNHLNINNFGF